MFPLCGAKLQHFLHSGSDYVPHRNTIGKTNENNIIYRTRLSSQQEFQHQLFQQEPQDNTCLCSSEKALERRSNYDESKRGSQTKSMQCGNWGGWMSQQKIGLQQGKPLIPASNQQSLFFFRHNHNCSITTYL